MQPALPRLRMSAVPRHLHPTHLGRPDHAATGMLAAQRADDHPGDGKGVEGGRRGNSGVHCTYRVSRELPCFELDRIATRGIVAGGISHVLCSGLRLAERRKGEKPV